MSMPVMSVEDMLVGKLLALNQESLDYPPLIAIARALREQIDWPQPRSRTRDSAYARGFFGLLGELDVLRSDRIEPSPVDDGPRVMILGPLPILSVTIEPGRRDGVEIHVHPGGQGVWAARMASLLEANVELCCALGGESGEVQRVLIERWNVTTRAARMDSESNAMYVHDRRSGERRVIAAETEPRPSRHEIDSLYSLALAAGCEPTPPS
jgi:hypothetical protein